MGNILNDLPALLKNGVKIKIGLDDPSVLKLALAGLAVGVAYLFFKKFVFKV